MSARRRYSDAPLITDENLINYRRTRVELEIFWLYCGFSVMRSRERAAGALAQLLDMGGGATPFARVKSLIAARRLRRALEATRLGGYTRLEAFLRDSVTKPLDLESGSAADFRKIRGVACAKSRFFVLCTRADARCAVLDRHILGFLRDAGYPVPDKTPTSERQYLRVESFWLQEVDKAGTSAARENLKRWRERAQT